MLISTGHKAQTDGNVVGLARIWITKMMTPKHSKTLQNTTKFLSLILRGTGIFSATFQGNKYTD